MALAGFTLLHLGNIYDGAPKYDQFQVNINKRLLQIILLYYTRLLHYVSIKEYMKILVCIENDL